MDPQSAARLVDALDKELSRRRARKDAAEDAQWLAELGDDPVALCALKLGRSVDRLATRLGESPSPEWLAMSEMEQDLQRRGLEELADNVSRLATMAERQCDREEDEAGGIVHRARSVGGPRSPHLLLKEPKPKGDNANGKKPKISRTEQARMAAEAELLAREALRRAAPPPEQQAVEETIIKIGTVQRYESRSMSGVVAFGGGPGRLELPFGGSAIMRSGITTLSPGQSIECQITRRPDSGLVVTEIKLSVGERAAVIAELERQAQAAEENYRIELMRRGLH